MEKHKGNGKRSLLDKVILGVVVAIALVVIALSFSNTALLARELGLNEYLTAGLVEILFASLLFIRGRQRATQRNVPFFLTIGYFTSLAFVTGVNMYGLYQQSPTVGPIVGGAISAAMWLMESVLVWLWVDSHRPHKKKMKELKREAEKEIAEIKLKQQIDWMRWEAQKPSLDLISKARKADEKRKAAVAGGLPIFFAEAITNTSEKSGGTNNTNITSSNYTSSTTSSGVSTTISARSGDAAPDTRNDTRENTTGYISENTSITSDTVTSTNEDVINSSDDTRDTRTITNDTKENSTRTNSEEESTSTNNTRNRSSTTSKGTRKKSASTSANRKTGGHLRLVDADLEQVKLVALAIYEKEGKLPGRPRLRKEAQCRENQARRVLAELKEQLEAI